MIGKFHIQSVDETNSYMGICDRCLDLDQVVTRPVRVFLVMNPDHAREVGTAFALCLDHAAQMFEHGEEIDADRV